MTVDVTTEIDIARPVPEVAAYAADPTNAPSWYANIDSIEWKTEPPAQIGSVVAFEARFLGRRLAYDYEFVELVPGQLLVMRTAQGTADGAGDATSEPHGPRRPEGHPGTPLNPPPPGTR